MEPVKSIALDREVRPASVTGTALWQVPISVLGLASH